MSSDGYELAEDGDQHHACHAHGQGCGDAHYEWSCAQTFELDDGGTEADSGHGGCQRVLRPGADAVSQVAPYGFTEEAKGLTA